MDQLVKIMPCLDMQDGRVVKGVHFVDIRDAGDPVECAKAYCETGADELALLDITATVEGRATMLDVVKRVAEVTTVPFTVGGGISDVKSAEAVLGACVHLQTQGLLEGIQTTGGSDESAGTHKGRTRGSRTSTELG